MKTIIGLVLISFLTSGIFPLTAAAQEVTPALLLQRIEALESEVRVLKRQLEVKEEDTAKKAPETAIVTASSKDGFTIKSPDDAYRIRLRGYVQADGRLFTDNKEDTGTIDTFVARRARPIIEGTVHKHYDFLIQPDFGNGSVVLVDAYAEYREFAWAKLRAGKFKSPFGLERLQSDTVSNFAETGLPSLLGPSRDTGVQLHGDLLDNTLYYAVGVFNGGTDAGSSGASDVDTNNDKDVVARLFSHPFRNSGVTALAGLGAGAAVSHGHNDGAQLPTLRSAGQAVIYSYVAGVTADGPHTRVSPQAYWYWHNAGVLAEYVSSDQDVVRTVSGQLVNQKVDNRAWQVSGTYVLTGEDASYKGVTPKNPFDWKSGGWGAWELAWRYGELDIDRDAFDLQLANPNASISAAKSAGLGINWHLNRNVKAVLNYERTRFEGGAPLGEDREVENVVLGRIQVVY